MVSNCRKTFRGGYSRLVIIDDGSKDNTYSLLKKYKEEKQFLVALTKPNEGHGATVMYGYNYALECKADFIFQTDSDGQTNPDEFELFWNDRNKYAVIFGNRISRGDGLFRAIVEKVLCMVLRYYFHVTIPDANAPFRLMKAEFLSKYLYKLPEKYNLPNAVITAMGNYYRENVLFKEISFQPRQKGTNSVNLKKILFIGIHALKDFKQISSKL